MQTEIVKLEDRQDNGQQNETKENIEHNNTTLKTKAGVTRTLKKTNASEVKFDFCNAGWHKL